MALVRRNPFDPVGAHHEKNSSWDLDHRSVAVRQVPLP